jgi:GEVED domain/Domain of unknown function DUF11/CARDB/HYR domain/Secretion system C-terminal sorting domain
MNKHNYFLSFLLILSCFSSLSSQQTYCASKGNTPWTEWIANVQFGTINNASQKEGYGNFTSQTTTVTKGTSYPLSILQGFSWAADPTNQTQQGKVWIDYNQNGTFEEAELAASTTRTTVTANITIPTTALSGATRMRVSLKTTGAPTACEVFDKGEVEDYTINVGGGTTGGNLPDLVISNFVVPTTATGGSGSVINISYTVKNNSTINIPGSFVINTYYSTDQTLSSDDLQRGSLGTGNFQGGYTANVPNQIDATVPFGIYYLIAKIDGNNQIAESDENNNIIVSTNTINVGNVPNNSGCLNRFTLDFIFPNAGECTGIAPTPNVNPASLQMLGSRIADGFALYIRQTFNYDLQTRLFAKTAPTTTPPSGVTFRACTGANWLYFKTDGYSQDERFSSVIPSRYVRVAFFGAETNPDSILVETELSFGSSIILKSSGKSLNCNACVTSDRTPPVFNCPTTTITYSQPFSPNTLRIGNIINVGFGTPGTNVQATDNCNKPLIGFEFLNDVFWGGVYPISLVAYDSAGNKAACNFNLRMPCSASVTAPTITNCPTNISVQAATGQTCATATWTAPTFSGNGSPAALFSNFASGTCFPIGTTPVVLTAKDSCNNTQRCIFDVTVTGGNVSNCRNNYGLINFDPVNCQSSGGPPPTPAIGMLVEFLGATLADGFYLSTNNSSQPTNKSNLWSKTVVAPQPALFNNCPGNWTYFKAYGFSTIGEQVFENLDKVHENVIVRIKGIGTTNPLEQIIVEVSNTEGVFNFGSFQSSARRIKCSACSFTDNAPPVITNCPTTPVIFPLRDTKSYGAKEVSFSANIAISDNCSDNFSTFRTGNSFLNSNDGASFPLTLIAFDSAGNRATCNFTVKTSNANPTTYCASKGNTPWTEWIAGVQFANINNASQKEGYRDFTNLTANVIRGTSYPLSISQGFSWAGDPANATQRWAVWIDYNKNNVFEASELAASGTRTSATANILIPTTATIGTTRMRVSLKTTGVPTACETFDKGEVEDYTVNITGGVVVTDPCAGVQVVTRNVVWKDFYVELEVGVTGGAADQAFVFQYPSIRQITDQSTTYTANGIVNMNQFTTLKSAPTGFSPPLYVGAANSVSFNGFIATPGQNTCDLPPVVLVRPIAANQPDLTLTNLAVPTSPIAQGQILNFTFSLKNQGTAAATGNFNVKSYLSKDKTLSVDDYQDGIVPTGNFAAGQLATQVAGALAVNSTVAAGIYYVILKVDADDQIVESNEFNNVIVTPYSISVTGGTATLPDLRITNITPAIDLVNTTFKTGDVFGISCTVVSDNVVAAGPMVTTFYFSSDAVLDAQDALWTSITTGTNETFTAGGAVPQLTDGDYFIIGKINSNNAIQESNVNNNIFVLQTPKVKIRNGVTKTGDVSLSITASKPNYVKYETIRFKVTAQNVGNQALTNVVVELKRPAFTSNGGPKVASVGTFQDFCPGGIECSEWRIPSLAAGATATLDAPFFVLDATAPIVVTTKLLGSTPTDANATNNTASVTVSPAGAAGTAAPILGLRRQTPTQYIPLIVQSIAPNPTEGDVVVEVESLTAQDVQFEFSNAMGQTVQSEKRAIEKGTNQVHFDVYEFTQGVYFIQTSVGKGRNAPTKFVKF